ncbi:MarR family winged helix-turn-helix transcriptional regulator [Brucella cytisi]|uniref:MarR family winged helix-turn-helix transcriptional regulator n=1 Tax=Brucella TaxID=234 RepID=UPI00142DE269|nr:MULTISPECIES: MarR family transcriptional regulator [Brucella]MCR8493765.1 winged helix DNA-binding protein [Brucella anthropi]NKC51205.1 winged helix DNA-binding protein [Brucella cytisi]
MNYLALRFNNPVYGLIQQQLGLLRPEFVVLWSLYLSAELTLTEVVRSSGFPKNTLSRAVNKLDTLGMISRELDPIDQRRVALKLTEKGRLAVEAVEAKMMDHERMMLESLSPAERLNLSEILTKLVVASESWPQQLVADLEPIEGEDT